jgi:hypothetical protein
MTTPTANPQKRGFVDRAALISLVGLAVLSVVGAGVVSIYLNRLSTSAASMTRLGDMPDYVGRPAPVTAADGNAAMNLLILIDQDGQLDSAVVANLSASRRTLTLIAVPAELRVSDGSTESLAGAYEIDPSIAALAMEGLTGARMDHEMQLSLTCLGSVIDHTGGIQLSGSLMSGADAIRHTQADAASASGAVSTARMLRSALIGLERHYSGFDPSRFADMLDAVAPCAQVDNGLTSQVVQSTFFESSVHPDETRIWPLATTPSGPVVDASEIATDELRTALANPEISTTVEYQQTAFVPQEAGR